MRSLIGSPNGSVRRTLRRDGLHFSVSGLSAEDNPFASAPARFSRRHVGQPVHPDPSTFTARAICTGENRILGLTGPGECPTGGFTAGLVPGNAGGHPDPSGLVLDIEETVPEGAGDGLTRLDIESLIGVDFGVHCVVIRSRHPRLGVQEPAGRASLLRGSDRGLSPTAPHGSQSGDGRRQRAGGRSREIAMADGSATSYRHLLEEALELGRLDGRFAAAFESPAGLAGDSPRSLGRTPAEFASLLWDGQPGSPPSGLELNAPAWYAVGVAEGLADAAR